MVGTAHSAVAHPTNYPTKRKWPPLRGPSALVIPVMVTPDHDRAVAIAIVPAAMPAAVMSVELDARPAIIVAVAIIVVRVAADAEAEPLGARHGRRRDHEGRQRSENARKLLHVASPIVVLREEKTCGAARRSWNSGGTFLNRHSDRLLCCKARNNHALLPL